MLPKSRRRALAWPFGRRKNRRLRAGTPVLPPAPRPPLGARLVAALERQRRTLALAGVGLAVAAVGCCAYWYLVHSKKFAITAVRATPTEHVRAEALVARAGVPLGANLFSIDRDAVARRVAADPWVARVAARRELPSTLTLEVRERQSACTIALGSLYLADGDGLLFKRATAAEAAALPVVTGFRREDYLTDPARVRRAIKLALAALSGWRAEGSRPPIGEVHVDRVDPTGGVTLYTDRGLGVRIGAVDETLATRLRRYDAVAAALQKSGEAARLVYVDNRARPDRVTVKLALAQTSLHSGQSEKN